MKGNKSKSKLEGKSKTVESVVRRVPPVDSMTRRADMDTRSSQQDQASSESKPRRSCITLSVLPKQWENANTREAKSLAFRRSSLGSPSKTLREPHPPRPFEATKEAVIPSPPRAVDALELRWRKGRGAGWARKRGVYISEGGGTGTVITEARLIQKRRSPG